MSMYFYRLQSPTGSIDTAQAEGTGRRAQSSAKELEVRLDRALLACEAMWTIMREKLDVTDVELVERINDIDLSDGVLDGKVRKSAASCPSCKRTISTRLPRCIYCSQPIVQDPFA